MSDGEREEGRRARTLDPVDRDAASAEDRGRVLLENVREMPAVARERHSSLLRSRNRVEELSREAVGHLQDERSVHPAFTGAQDSANPRGPERKQSVEARLEVLKSGAVAGPGTRLRSVLELPAILGVDLILEE